LDKAWKAYERRIAKDFPQGTRTGPDFRNKGGGGNNDIQTSAPFGVEIKLIGAPTYSLMTEACHQAERNSDDLQCPIAIVKRKGHDTKDSDALVIMLYGTWKQWYLSPNTDEGESDE
jgi:hypothetical protein